MDVNKRPCYRRGVPVSVTAAAQYRARGRLGAPPRGDNVDPRPRGGFRVHDNNGLCGGTAACAYHNSTMLRGAHMCSFIIVIYCCARARVCTRHVMLLLLQYCCIGGPFLRGKPIPNQQLLRVGTLAGNPIKTFSQAHRIKQTLPRRR